MRSRAARSAAWLGEAGGDDAAPDDGRQRRRDGRAEADGRDAAAARAERGVARQGNKAGGGAGREKQREIDGTAVQRRDGLRAEAARRLRRVEHDTAQREAGGSELAGKVAGDGAAGGMKQRAVARMEPGGDQAPRGGRRRRRR